MFDHFLWESVEKRKWPSVTRDMGEKERRERERAAYEVHY